MTQDQPNRLDRIEATQAVHSQILNELAVAHRELTEFSVQQAQRTEERLTRSEQLAQQNSEAIAQLVTATNRNTAAIARHDEALTRIEEQTRQNAENMSRLEQRMNQLSELVTTSTTETIQLVARQAVQAERDRQAWQEDRQTWQAEIRRIWEYLERQTGNGNGRSEQ
ncbi:hypothetical protein [Fischerella sp. PCC 9605]|uniref:hypothetical protein n=1 Tax=Fischerella sp. PCC 9605 TaxID=1173024 RepID=UPI00047BAA0D|nr:hypothetical protein [Fischerella sp. PCC 9605]